MGLICETNLTSRLGGSEHIPSLALSPPYCGIWQVWWLWRTTCLNLHWKSWTNSDVSFCVMISVEWAWNYTIPLRAWKENVRVILWGATVWVDGDVSELALLLGGNTSDVWFGSAMRNTWENSARTWPVLNSEVAIRMAQAAQMQSWQDWWPTTSALSAQLRNHTKSDEVT